SDTSRSLVSLDGTLGHEVRRIQEFVYPWSPDAELVLCSDGVIRNALTERVAGLSERHPSIAAAILLRRFVRGRDDATVVVARSRRTDWSAP
ncbi:MAG TPA: serine/threonine protein kinase, partial [Planctomycetota bacterium]|nr:serine/threonine protein kinase [Planctomycetota bacterium]